MTLADTNPVGFLQEFVQKNNVVHLLQYREFNEVGPIHSKFTYTCLFDGNETTGTSNQKKQAKYKAAKNMIELLEKKQYFKHSGPMDRFKTSLQGALSDSEDIVEMTSRKNPISALQEHLQYTFEPFPGYREAGLSDAGLFICECTVKRRQIDYKTIGYGRTKQAAKTEAAAYMCNKLQISFSELIKNGNGSSGNQQPAEDLSLAGAAAGETGGEFQKQTGFMISLRGRGSPNRQLLRRPALHHQQSTRPTMDQDPLQQQQQPPLYSQKTLSPPQDHINHRLLRLSSMIPPRGRGPPNSQLLRQPALHHQHSTRPTMVQDPLQQQQQPPLNSQQTLYPPQDFINHRGLSSPFNRPQASRGPLPTSEHVLKWSQNQE